MPKQRKEMGKRKRVLTLQDIDTNGLGAPMNPFDTQAHPDEKRRKVQQKRSQDRDAAAAVESVSIQIVAGTYEKALHGLTATLTSASDTDSERLSHVVFADTFLFNAHESAIRCVAVSSPAANTERVILASGSSDQVVNLYSISTVCTLSEQPRIPLKPSLAGMRIIENPQNKEIGSLQHHGGSINALRFPTRSKLISAAADNTIAVARTRDWTVLSTIKAPNPKISGRPSGDTGPLGDAPAGVNDFAIHPSLKLMLSVGKGEKCMRLWNLITGKRAAVLNFDRDTLASVDEGKHSTGEGTKVRWNNTGDEFVVAFERGCVVYGTDSKPICSIQPYPKTKVHQLLYMPLATGNDRASNILALSTEDGRILFYQPSKAGSLTNTLNTNSPIPSSYPIAQLGGQSEGLVGRIKDFVFLSGQLEESTIIVTGSSNGTIRVWSLDCNHLTNIVASQSAHDVRAKDDPLNGRVEPSPPAQIGKLVGDYEIGNRITCLTAFVMSKECAE